MYKTINVKFARESESIPLFEEWGFESMDHTYVLDDYMKTILVDVAALFFVFHSVFPFRL